MKDGVVAPSSFILPPSERHSDIDKSNQRHGLARSCWMSFFNINRFTCSLALLVGAACLWTAMGARAQAPGGQPGNGAGGGRGPRDVRPPVQLPLQAPDELVVRLAPGVNAQALAAQYGANAKALRFTRDTYVFQGIQGSLQGAFAALQQQYGVLLVGYNRFYRPLAVPQVTPNDTFYRQQWAPRQINAPTAWGITVGERFVNGPRKNVEVALID